MKLNLLGVVALSQAAQISLDSFNDLGLSAQDLAAIESLSVSKVMFQVLAENSERLARDLNRKSKPIKYERRDDWEIVATSEKFPNHQIRARNPEKLGIDNVKQWSGYVDVLDEDKHFFFWFFESRHKPKEDPFVLWLNGGPGCSSSAGEFFELGPSMVTENLTMEYNPYSWNNKANLMFLDQPVNVGFSYSTVDVDTTVLAAEDVYKFLSLFFEEFPEYTGRDFHIAGESYGGHYMPAIGAEILKHEDRNFNLSSVMIGNGITDFFNQEEAQIGMACGLGGYPSVLEPETCDSLYKKLPVCQEMTQGCYQSMSSVVCLLASYYCSTLSTPYYETGRSPYDIRDTCGGDCYPQIKWIEDYLSLPQVQKEAGAEPMEHFNGCNSDVGLKFGWKGDLTQPFQQFVVDILEHDVPVLIYAGDKDYICNWLGNQAWTNKLSWEYHDEFASKPLHPWYVDGEKAGEVKSAGPLTFLRVYDAGHMVPFNKPKQSSVFLNKWIHGNYKLH